MVPRRIMSTGCAQECRPMRKALFLFAELNDDEVDWVARSGRLRRFAPGEVLIQ